MVTETVSRLRLLYLALEHLVGPVLVFVICYAQHLYFASESFSSIFAASALVSLLFVMAFEQAGLILAYALQVVFLAYLAFAAPLLLTEQLLFSASLAISLFATYLNVESDKADTQSTDNKSLLHQKEKLWQELFDARQEITRLYHQKQELEASLDAKLAEMTSQKDEKLLFLQHHLEAVMLEKAQLSDERNACEEDIKTLVGHMREMAENFERLKAQVPAKTAAQVSIKPSDYEAKPSVYEAKPSVYEAKPSVYEAKPSVYEAKYRQLKLQFESKSQVLDQTRKELFVAQEEIERLKKAQSDRCEPTQEEKRLMKELVGLQESIDALKKGHNDELVGYEEVIQGLLAQLSTREQSRQ